MSIATNTVSKSKNISLLSYLTRIICLCAMPAIVVACLMALSYHQTIQTQQKCDSEESASDIAYRINNGIYRSAIVNAAPVLIITIVTSALAIAFGARLVARRISNSVGELAESHSGPPTGHVFTEVERVRNKLASASEARDVALSKLQQKEETLRLFVENSPVALAMFDNDMQYLEVSRKWKKDYGLEDRDIIGKSHYEVFPEIPDYWKEAHRRGLSGETLTENEDYFERSDGSPLWLRWQIRPWNKADKSVGGIIIFTEDVTSQKHSEVGLRKSYKRFQFAQEAAKGGVWEWDLLSKEVYWSEELWPLYGLEPHVCAPSYENWLETVHPDDRPIVECKINQSLADKTELHTEWRVNTSDNHFRYLMSRGHPVFDGRGVPVSYIGFVVDITDRKLIEEDLRKHKQDLEKLVGERTLEVSESYKLLCTIIENLPIAITYVDSSFRFTFSNRTFQSWWLKSAEQIIGRKVEEIIVENNGPALRQIKTALDGQQITEELTIKFADGITRDIWSRVVPDRGPDGLVRGVVRLTIDVSDLKKAQRKIEESELLFRSIFENTLDCILLTRPDGRVDRANPAACRTLGMSEEEICEVGRDGVVDATDRRLAEGLQERREHGIANIETNFRKKDGTFFPVELSSAIFTDAQCVERSIVSFKDMTLQKLAQKELRESEARFRSYFELPLIGIAITSVDKGWLEVNDETCALLGYSSKELFGSPWSALTHPDDLKADTAQFERILSGEIDTYSMEKRFIRKDGVIIWTNLSVGCVRNPDGAVEYLVALIQDISRRKQVEKELQDSLEFLNTLLNAIPNQVWFKNIDGKYLGCNESFASLVGVNRDELIGKTVYDVAPIEIADVSFQKDEELFKTPGVQVYEYVLKLKDGSIRPVILSKATFVDSSGRLAGVVGVIQDISDRVKAEQEKEILQAQLFESQKLASLGTLVGGLAHDFNNMLQVITGYSEILMDEVPKDSTHHCVLQTILDTSIQGAQLITKLLAFVQQSQVFPKPLELNDEIRDLRKFIGLNLPNTVQLDMDLVDETTLIKADSGQIDQVILSLVTNSSEAMPDGGRIRIWTRNVCLDEVYCMTHKHAKPGSYVMMAVADTGRGMDEHTLSRIFDPFFSTKPRGNIKGMGLGLSVVRGIVQQQGGFITCTSEPGNGAEFDLYFRAMESAQVVDQTVTPRIEATGTETVLLVEDVSFIAELERLFLETAGFEVLLASNGLEALNIYRDKKDHISLVILDLLMPVMSGKDCLTELIKMNPSVKVLIVSGYSPEDELCREIAPFVKGFVTKPCRRSELLAKARKALDS